MSKIVFTTDLSVKGIKNLRKQLQDYVDKDLQQKIQLLTQRLAEKGALFAQVRIKTLDAVFTGELLNSMKTVDGGSAKGTSVFFVVADNRHAAFVEFGTGQIGQEAPYPYPLPPGTDWEYMVGKSIFEISPGQYGWFYQRDGNWYFTQGMPARPFMYETYLELANLVLTTAREVFK